MKKFYQISKKRALKLLGLSDFSEMREDKVGQFVSLARKMDPEVVKAAINQFPEFKDMALQMTASLKEILNTSLEYNNHSQDIFYDACNSVLASLDEQLKDDEIDKEERAAIQDNMLQVLKMMSDKDSENKKHIEKAVNWVIGGAVILGVAAISYFTGGNINLSSSTSETDGDKDYTDIDYYEEIDSAGTDSETADSI